MSEIFTLSASANILSFSMSDAFVDLVSGQKNMLTPDGESGNSQKNSQFQRLLTNDELGLNAVFSE